MSTVTTSTLKPLRDSVFVSDLDGGLHRTQGGLILPDDNMKDSGIHPRWAKVYAVGPEVEEVRPGDWVLVAHGRWTNGIDFALPEGAVKLWRIDFPEAVLLVADSDPRLEQFTFS